MRVRQSNNTKQTLFFRLRIVIGSSLFFVLSVLLIRVYPGEVIYDWKSHVRVEESHKKAKKGSIQADIQVLEAQQKDLTLKKVPVDSKLVQDVKRSLELHNSLKDYKAKLNFYQSEEEKEFLKNKIESLEKDIKKLSATNYEQ